MKNELKEIHLFLTDILSKKVAHIYEVDNNIIQRVSFFTKPSNKKDLFNHINQIIKKTEESNILLNINDFATYALSKNTIWYNNENLKVNYIPIIDSSLKTIHEERIKQLEENYKDNQKRLKKYEASSTTPDKNTLIVYTDASAVSNKSYKESASGYAIVIREPGSDNIMYKIKSKFSTLVPSAEAEAFAVKRALRFVKEQMDKGNIPSNLKVEVRTDNLGNVEKVNNYLNDMYDIVKEDTLKETSDYIKNNFSKNKISIKWVKGHHIDPYNLMVDKLAKESLNHKDSSFIVAYRDKEVINKNRKKNKI